MTKEEFIAGYCERSGVTWEELSKDVVALPCRCEDESCHGWAMVTNDPRSVQHHKFFYGKDQAVTSPYVDGEV